MDSLLQYELMRRLLDEQELRNRLANYSDADLKSEAEAGAFPERMGEINQTRRMAEALRMTPQPTGGMAGRVYVGANPLQYLASMGQQLLGAHMSKDADDEVRRLINNSVSARITALRNSAKGGDADLPVDGDMAVQWDVGGEGGQAPTPVEAVTQPEPEQLGIDLTRGGMPIGELGMDLGALHDQQDRGYPEGVGIDLRRGGVPMNELGMDLGSLYAAQALRKPKRPEPLAAISPFQFTR